MTVDTLIQLLLHCSRRLTSDYPLTSTSSTCRTGKTNDATC